MVTIFNFFHCFNFVSNFFSCLGLEVVEPATEDCGILTCKLCGKRIKDQNSYFAHMFFIHNHQDSRDAVVVQIEKEQERKEFVFCPKKGCKTKNKVEKDAVLHFAIDHGYLEMYLTSKNQLSILNKKEKISDAYAFEASKNLSQSTVETVGTVETVEWKTVPSCPICLKCFKGSQFQRAAHFLEHFKPDFLRYLQMRHMIELSSRQCCSITFNDDPTFFMHFGEQHGLFDLFIKEKRKRGQMSDNNEFYRFLDNRSDSLPRDTTTVRPKTTCKPAQSVTGIEKCKVCSLIFERFKKNGEAQLL